jgi:cytidylate kinase
VRAKRRFDELVAKGEQPVYADVLQDVNTRDYRDTHRTESPLRKAEDAVVIDNSHLTREEQMQVIRDIFNKAVKD